MDFDTFKKTENESDTKHNANINVTKRKVEVYNHSRPVKCMTLTVLLQAL